MSTGDLYTRLQAAFLLLDDGDRRLLARHGLTPTQLATLNALDPFEGHRLIDIAGRLLVDKSTVTRLIDRLEQQGLVQRVADPADRCGIFRKAALIEVVTDSFVAVPPIFLMDNGRSPITSFT